MSLINFGYRVDMYAIDPPTDPSAYIVAYDLDGILKQKDYLGNVTILGGGSIGPQGVPGPVGPGGLTWSGYWMATQSYNVNYAVGYASASWWCIADIVGSASNTAPNIDTIHWALLAAQGSPGPMGPGGTAGTPGPPGATGGVGLTPSLQQVGNIGTTFSKTTIDYTVNFDIDNNAATKIERIEGTEVTRYYQEGIQIDITHDCPESDWNSEILFNRGHLSLSQGIMSTSKKTTIDFIDPTNNTSLKVPAKGVDGVYTIATLDDLSLQVVTDGVGNNETTNPIAIQSTIGFNRIDISSDAQIVIQADGSDNSFVNGFLLMNPNTIQMNSNITSGSIVLDSNNSSLTLGAGVITPANYASGDTWLLPDNGGLGGTLALRSDLSSTFYTATNSNSQDITSPVYRTGSISIGTSSIATASKLFIYATQSGALVLRDGTEGVGYTLTSDENGVATWTASKVIISATYGALENLVATNQLVVGGTYILLEYKTIYQINGSNTTGIISLQTVIGAAASVYSQFVNVPSTIGGPGNFAGVTVTVVSVPPGGTLTVGQTVAISSWFSSSYIIFSPTVVGVNIGTVLKFEKQRYTNVTPGATYSDIYGKPIMKPGGVLNTEVHDGTPYMSMTASENPAVLTESIILKAIDTNKFSREAESLTFPGDKLIYDYTDNIVYDENGDFRASKPGTIIQRSNISGTIVMNKDWRVQRYRRYAVDSTNWSKLTLATASIYKIGANSECTVTNTSITTNHKYIASDPYIDNFFNDFSKSVDNVFLTGTNSAPAMSAGERSNYQLSGYEYMNNLNISSFTSSVKDFNIIPISNGQPTALVEKCIINNVNNTVFLPNSQTYGSTFNLNVDSKNGDITNSTFISLPMVLNTGKINKLTVIDYITLSNFSTYNNTDDTSGSILNSLMLSYASYVNTGEIVNTTIGGGLGFSTAFNNIQFSNSSLYNCVVGGHRNNNMIIDNLKANKSLICLYASTLMSISGKIYLTALKNSSSSSYTSNIKLNTFNSTNPNKSLYGYLYDFNVNLSDMELNNMTLDKRLVYQYLDNSNVLISATVSVAQ